MTTNITVAELLLLVEALTMAASRHESMSRFNPKAAAPHDKKAAAMHALKQRLLKAKAEPETRRAG